MNDDDGGNSKLEIGELGDGGAEERLVTSF